MRTVLLRLSRAATSLRATVTLGLAVVALLAVVTAVLLIVLTTRLRTSGERVASGLHSLRAAQEAEVELLLHARAGDLTLRSVHEGAVRRHIDVALEGAVTADELRAAREVADALQGYFAASAADAQPAALSEAFAALERLVDATVERSAAALAEAEKGDRFANNVGLATLLAVIPLVAALTWWLWLRAFEPLFGLGAAMQRFAAGGHEARARVAGPQELRQMAERFNELAGELARRREAQAAFLAGVAHDLRNPLSPLKVAASVLAERTPELPAEVRGLLRIVGRQVDHMDRIVGDLLDVTRIEAGRLELRLERVDVCAMAAEAVELFRPTAVRNELRLALPSRRAAVQGDPVRLQQVFNNLLSNAIKYSPLGGPVEVTVCQRGAEVTVCVADSGIGMAEEELRQVFAPFRRARRATDAAIPGVGLGLYVARRIIEAHGGTLTVRSSPGEGSAFLVTLRGVEPADTEVEGEVASLQRQR
jgi:signal transduction histidine kinase